MSSKKIYFISILAGLVVGLGVILAVKNFSSGPDAEKNIPVVLTGWVEVAPSTQLFTAKFPVSPERTEAELPIPGTDYSIIQEFHVATDVKGNVFHVGTFIYPQSFSAEQTAEALDAALHGMVTAVPGSALLENTNAKFDDLPAKIFMIQDKDGYYHQGQLFLKGRVLYQAFVTYEGGEISEDELNYFLDSFTPTTDVEVTS
jgi:hypothetical protein